MNKYRLPHPLDFNNITHLKTKRIFLVSLCFAALSVTACQPKNQETDQINDAPNAEMTTHEKMEHTNDSHVNQQQEAEGHKDHDMGTMISTEFGKEYMEDMDDMHEDMMEAIKINDADVAFAKGMLPHHEGAVDMAETQLKYGKNDAMRKLAQNIITTQEIEIKQMKNWLKANKDTAEQDYTKQMQQAYSSGMSTMHNEMMNGLQSEDADMAFAKGMLAHHKGAIAMAKVQLEYGKDEEMIKLAQAIIEAQAPEIDLMQNWIEQHS